MAQAGQARDRVHLAAGPTLARVISHAGISPGKALYYRHVTVLFIVIAVPARAPPARDYPL